MGKIENINEDPNGEMVEKTQVIEDVIDIINENDLDKIIQIENLKIQYENNELLKQILTEQRNFSKVEDGLVEIKYALKRNDSIKAYLRDVLDNTNSMKGIMIFWLIITILSLIGSIYTAVKISGFFSIIGKY